MNDRHDQDKRFNGGESKNANCTEAAAKNRFSLFSISLPKSGAPLLASWRFAANLVTCPGLLTVPMNMNPGRFGFRSQFVFLAYALAVVTVGGAVLITLELGSAVKHTPTLFLCSVALSSWFGGMGPGVFAGVLSKIEKVVENNGLSMRESS
jgi:hypothetical protein